MPKKKTATGAKSSSWSRLPAPVRVLLPWATAATAFIVLAINLEKFIPIWARWQFASHEYVDGTVNSAKKEIKRDIDDTKTELKSSLDSTNYILRDMQIEQAQGKLDANADAITKWKIELSKAQDPQTRVLVEGTIKDLESRVRSLSDQINTLSSIRARVH